MEATFWALVPPILAIVISLITKEVNRKRQMIQRQQFS